MLPFSKYQALGNDFVVVDARQRPELLDDAPLAVRLLDRHRGVGADDLIFVEASAIADLRMRIRTPSGGWLAICGNGIRCLGRYARDLGLWRGERLRVETDVGIRDLTWDADAEAPISVDLDQPELRAGAIPTNLAAPDQPVLDALLDLSSGPHPGALPEGAARQPLLASRGPYALRHPLPASLRVSCVSVGNPHAVIFVESLAKLPLSRAGPAVERHPAFPEGVNVHAAEVLAPDRARIATWERGAGLSLA